MNDREIDAYHAIKKHNVSGPTALATLLGIKKQWAGQLIKRLDKLKLITYEPGRWKIK